MKESREFLVSIIIVTYNAEKYIASALDSIILNYNETTEIIIVDGKSTDMTIEILKRYNAIINKIISEDDQGIYDAMNKGVSFANGRYVYFLGADDRLLIHMNSLSGLLKNDKVIYYGDVIVQPLNKLYGGKFNLFKLLNRNICHQGIFYPVELFKMFNYDIKYKQLSDYVLNMQLWASKMYKFQYLNIVIAEYSLNGVSSRVIDSTFKKELPGIIYALFGIKGLIIKSSNPIINIFKR